MSAIRKAVALPFVACGVVALAVGCVILRGVDRTCRIIDKLVEALEA